MKTSHLLYIHIPRTAGTHLEKILGFKGHDAPPRCGSAAYGANHKELMGWDKETKIMLQHATYNQLVLHNFISADNDLIKLATVRNPYHRVISLFKYFGGERKWISFENFLTHLETGGISGYFYMPQWKYIQDAEFNIIRFENFLPDVESLKKKYNLKFNATFKSKEQAEKSERACRKYYTHEEIKSRVLKLYKRDFEILNYSKATYS
jgi:hypothetical protein